MQNNSPVVLLLGEAQTGKTSWMRHVLKEDGDDSYEPTVEDIYPVAEEVRGQMITVTFLDTGGSIENERNIPNWVSESNFQVLFINLENPPSLEYLRNRTELLAAAKPRLLGGMIVGNLPSGNAANRKVSKQEGINFAASLSFAEFSYMEINTATGDGVDLAIAALMESLGKTLPLSGAELAATTKKDPFVVEKPTRDTFEDKEPFKPGHSREASRELVSWAFSLGLSNQACDIVKKMTWKELEVMFSGNAVPAIKIEMKDYGFEKACDRNKLIAGWQTRESRTKESELLEQQQKKLEQQEKRIKELENTVEQQNKQIRLLTSRLEIVETQTTEASLTHRIQEMMLRQLQAIGLAKKDPPPPSVTLPVGEDNTPVKSKALRGGRKTTTVPVRGGGLFHSPATSH